MSTKLPAGDSAAVSTLRPSPDKMAEFLPLWNKRNAHIEAADKARAQLAELRVEADAIAASVADGSVPRERGYQYADRIRELADVAQLHEAEAQSLTAQMQPLQYQAEA